MRQRPPNNKGVYDKRPRVAFRCYNVEYYGLNSSTGFRAGRYTGTTDAIPPPLDMMDAAFEAESNKHLSKNMTGATSFISVRDNILPAFHEAMHKSNASIAVINLEAANSNTRVYSAALAIRKLNKAFGRAWHKENQYRGSGEWLVWGEIPQQAVIATFTIKQLYAAFDAIGFSRIPTYLGFETIREHNHLIKLRKSFRSTPRRVCHAAGVAIGIMVKSMGVPDRFLGNVVQVFVRDWELVGDQHVRVREDFVRGVVVDGFLGFEDEGMGMSELFEGRVRKLRGEVDGLVWWPARLRKVVLGKGRWRGRKAKR